MNLKILVKMSNGKGLKGLTLRDIHVGDWVQAWRPLPKEYTPPMKVSSIHYDGTVYLVSDDEGHCNPFEANIKDIDALPIDADLFRGFGFVVTRPYVDWLDTYRNVYYKEKYIGQIRYNPSNTIYFRTCGYEYQCLHELVDYWYRNHINIKLEWKGIEK